jgi:hypothetical protein
MYRSFKIQTFQLTSNDPALIIENATFPELVSTVATTVEKM